MKLQSAFTLIELLMVISVTAIALAFAFPFLSSFYQRTQDEVIQTQWLATVAFAKQAAFAYHTPVTIAKYTSWSAGWQVFIDPDQSGQLSNANNLLKVVTLPPHPLTLYWHSYPYYRDYVSFQPTTSMGEAEGIFWACYPHETHATWAIHLNRASRLRVLTAAESNVYSCNNPYQHA